MKLKFEVPLFLLLSAGVCYSQAVCLSTVDEALAGRGSPAANGFRLEAVVGDPLNGRRWARVERCAHPEWPPLLLAAPERQSVVLSPLRPAAHAVNFLPNLESHTTAQVPTVPVVRAGETVTLIEHTALVRLDVQAVALNSASAGETVRVRVGRLDTGAPQVVLGTARRRSVVELTNDVAEQR